MRNCLNINTAECSMFQLALVWPCTSNGRAMPLKFRNGSHLFEYLYGRRSPDDHQEGGDPWTNLIDLFETVAFNRGRKYNNLHALNNKISGSRKGGPSCHKWVAVFTKDCFANLSETFENILEDFAGYSVIYGHNSHTPFSAPNIIWNFR